MLATELLQQLTDLTSATLTATPPAAEAQSSGGTPIWATLATAAVALLAAGVARSIDAVVERADRVWEKVGGVGLHQGAARDLKDSSLMK